MKPLQQDLQSTRWDAIVVGSGITGGWAAKELSEKGLRTLVLEAGPQMLDQYPEHVPSWEMKFRGLKDRKFLAETRPVQSRTGACDEWSAKFFVNDLENPYSTADGTDFDWIRSRQVGGRSMLWGRQSYRWSDLDFEAERARRCRCRLADSLR